MQRSPATGKRLLLVVEGMARGMVRALALDNDAVVVADVDSGAIMRDFYASMERFTLVPMAY